MPPLREDDRGLLEVLLLFRWLLLFFIVTPIVEMYLLLTVGDMIGAIPTIGLVLLTALIGVAMLRQQGLATLTRAQARMAEGSLPTTEMADGLLLAVAGPLLVTPGFATDAMGFALLTPAVRRWLGRGLASRLMAHTVVASAGTRPGSDPFDPIAQPRDPSSRMGPKAGTKSGSVVIDGEYERRDEDQ